MRFERKLGIFRINRLVDLILRQCFAYSNFECLFFYLHCSWKWWSKLKRKKEWIKNNKHTFMYISRLFLTLDNGQYTENQLKVNQILQRWGRQTKATFLCSYEHIRILMFSSSSSSSPHWNDSTKNSWTKEFNSFFFFCRNNAEQVSCSQVVNHNQWKWMKIRRF